MFYADQLVEKNQMEAVKHLLEIRHIRNPEAVVKVGDRLYAHTNKRGATKTYRVFSTNKQYSASEECKRGKLYRVNSFYIVECALEAGQTLPCSASLETKG